MITVLIVGLSILVASTFDIIGSLYIAIITAFGFTGIVAINNISDIEIDLITNPRRGEITKNLGRKAWVLAFSLLFISLGAGILTQKIWIPFLQIIAFICGCTYSFTPLRLRETFWKLPMTSAEGIIPILIAIVYYDAYTLYSFAIAGGAGFCIVCYALWSDISDYLGDIKGGSKTLPVTWGLKSAIIFAIILTYGVVILLFVVGYQYVLNIWYFVIALGGALYLSIRYIKKNRFLQNSNDVESLYGVGKTFTKDFKIFAAIQVFNVLIAAILV